MWTLLVAVEFIDRFDDDGAGMLPPGKLASRGAESAREWERGGRSPAFGAWGI